MKRLKVKKFNCISFEKNNLESSDNHGEVEADEEDWGGEGGGGEFIYQFSVG